MHFSQGAVACLQGFFGFFNRLNSYWVAPLVNLVFVLTAILAQLFILSSWGNDCLQWVAHDSKHAPSKQADHQPGTEHRRLLATTDLDGSQQYTDSDSVQNSDQHVARKDSSGGLYIEMSDAPPTLLHQRGNLPSH